MQASPRASPLFVAPKPLRGFAMGAQGRHMSHRRPVSGISSTLAAQIQNFDASCSDMDGGESDWPAASKMSESEEGGASSEVGRIKRRISTGVMSDAGASVDGKAPAAAGGDVGENSVGGRAAKRVRSSWRPDESAVLAQPSGSGESSKRQLRPRFAPPDESMVNDGGMLSPTGSRSTKTARRPQARRKVRKGPTPRDFDRLKGDHKKLHARYTLLKAKYSKLKGMHALATSQNRELRRGVRPIGKRERGGGSSSILFEVEGERSRRVDRSRHGGVDAEELKQRLVCTQLQQFELSP